MTKSPLLPISKNDTTVMKGIGILLIMFHNFFHLLVPMTGENEFIFNISHVLTFVNEILASPAETLNLLFSFLGFYGVTLFFFLSAYGLTISYRKNQDISYLNFIKHRFIKLYPAFIISILLLILWHVVTNDDLSFRFFRSLMYKILLISNIVPREALSHNGPLWFFVAIIQFYFVFPLMMKGQKKYGNKFLMIVGLSGFVIRILCKYFEWRTHFTCLPYLFELSLGMYLASIREIKLNKIVIKILVVLSFLVFCAGNYYEEVWYFASSAFLIVFLFSYPKIRTGLNYVPPLNNFFTYIGSMSFYLFLIHGPLRFPLLDYAQKVSALGKIGYSLAFFILSFIFAYFLKCMEQKVFAWWDKKTKAPRIFAAEKNGPNFGQMLYFCLKIGRG